MDQDKAILSKERTHWNAVQCGECGSKTAMPCYYCKWCGKKLDRDRLKGDVYGR